MSGGPEEGVVVHLYTEDGTDLNVFAETDEEGKVVFEGPVDRNFKLKVDLLENTYWSDVFQVSGGGSNTISFDTGGGFFQIVLQGTTGTPIEGSTIELCNTNNDTLGISGVTDASGIGGFYVPEGTYKVKAEYLGHVFYSPETLVLIDTNRDFIISHQAIEITVQSVFQGDSEPIEDAVVHLFTGDGQDLEQQLQTDAAGKVVFNLPEKPYKVRIAYSINSYESDAFTWQDTVVPIPMG